MTDLVQSCRAQAGLFAFLLHAIHAAFVYATLTVISTPLCARAPIFLLSDHGQLLMPFLAQPLHLRHISFLRIRRTADADDSPTARRTAPLPLSATVRLRGFSFPHQQLHQLSPSPFNSYHSDSARRRSFNNQLERKASRGHAVTLKGFLPV